MSSLDRMPPSGVLFFPPSSSVVIRNDCTCHSYLSIPLHYWYQPHLHQTAQSLCVLNSSHYGPTPPMSSIINPHHAAFVPGEIRFQCLSDAKPHAFVRICASSSRTNMDQNEFHTSCNSQTILSCLFVGKHIAESIWQSFVTWIAA